MYVIIHLVTPSLCSAHVRGRGGAGLCPSSQQVSLLGARLPHLTADARLLQQILLHTGALDHSLPVEEDLQILAEAAGVVVADRFGVPERCAGQDEDSGVFRFICCGGCAGVPSSMGLDSRISRSVRCSDISLLTDARYRRISLVLSVFPAPDSPLQKSDALVPSLGATLLNSPHLMMQHWFCRCRIMRL